MLFTYSNRGILGKNKVEMLEFIINKNCKNSYRKYYIIYCIQPQKGLIVIFKKLVSNIKG
jgi:hypothetical protein